MERGTVTMVPGERVGMIWDFRLPFFIGLGRRKGYDSLAASGVESPEDKIKLSACSGNMPRT
jgi:hypothetical protein